MSLISDNYSETLILQSWILRFSWIYALFTWSWPITLMLDFNKILNFCNLTLPLIFTFIFLVLSTKIYLTLHFVVKLLQFIFQDNRPLSLLAVPNISLWKYVSNGWFVICACTMWLHYSKHEWLIPPPWSKKLKRKAGFEPDVLVY